MNNLIMGVAAASEKNSGTSNVILGSYSNYNGGAGAQSTIIGAGAGYNATGSGNVLLGYNAGFNETGSNKLYIANNDTSTPLIGGDFSTKKVNISDIVNLRGVSNYPANPVIGDMVRLLGPTPAAGLYIFSSTGWKSIVSL